MFLLGVVGFIFFGAATDTEFMRIETDGDVGIGTTAPITRLVVDTPMNRGQTNPSGLIVTDSANGLRSSFSLKYSS